MRKKNKQFKTTSERKEKRNISSKRKSKKEKEKEKEKERERVLHRGCVRGFPHKCDGTHGGQWPRQHAFLVKTSSSPLSTAPSASHSPSSCAPTEQKREMKNKKRKRM